MTINELQQIVDEYLLLYPDDAERLVSLQERLDIDEIFNNRKSFAGHGTGAAIVLSPDRTKLLLIHHKQLNRWMQPGGHWDPEDPNPWIVARREAEEETGQTDLTLLPILADKPHVPIDIDSHEIPANEKKQEPEHVHHDFRYLFVAQDEDLALKEDEVVDAQWVLLEDVASRAPDLERVVSKVQQFLGKN